MKKIRKAIDGLIASRKGILALIGLITIQVFLILTAIGFIGDWILKTGNVSFEFVKDVFIGGFTYIAAIITAYSAANLANKYIYKKKDENGRK